MDKKVDRIGEKFITNEGYKIEIIKYNSCEDCSIRFDNGVVLNNQNYSNIKKRAIKNPYHPSIFEVGYIGEGENKSRVNNKYTKAYNIWSHMLERCYNEKYHIKYPTYKGCSVHSDWHNFQVFAEWFEENYIEGFHLDKDILLKGNKIYSPETCCFVPQEINKIFVKRDKTRDKYPTGVYREGTSFIAKITVDSKSEHLGYYKSIEKAFQAYKEVKEKHIKEMAKLFKSYISEKAYQALINYKVEITD